ncbi:MAG: hypothetical protein ACR2FS_13490 [Phormidesmis sp.]
MANQKTAAKITAEQETLEAQAAQWRAIEPLLPQIIQRGVMALLDGAEPTSELGLSGAKSKGKPKQIIDKVIDWRNVPNAQLLQETSEPASAERLRRSMEAFEAFNQQSDWKLAPTPATLASHANVEDGYAVLWLARGGHQAKLTEYLNQLGFADVGAASVGNRVALSLAGVKSARGLLKWSESAYGDYDW